MKGKKKSKTTDYDFTISNTGKLKRHENKYTTFFRDTRCRKRDHNYNKSEIELEAKRFLKNFDDLEKREDEEKLARNCLGVEPSIVEDCTIYPYNIICRLKITFPSKNILGTGFFISPRCVITAGHNIFNCLTEKFALSVLVQPGYSTKEREEPIQQVATRFRTVYGYQACCDTDYDYGAIILDNCYLYDHLKRSFNYKSRLSNSEIVTSGYLGRRNLKETQYSFEGIYSKKSSFKIFYDFKTSTGISGGPILDVKPRITKVVGIHRGNLTTPGCNGFEVSNCSKEAIKIRRRMRLKWNEWTKL